MHFFKSSTFRHVVVAIIGAVIGVLYFGNALTAYADTQASVSIAANGQTIVHGAQVTSVTGAEIRATSKWGPAKVEWIIHVTGATNFEPEQAAEQPYVQVGDKIGFSGLLDMQAASLSVRAGTLWNESILQEGTSLEGVVLSVATDDVLVQTNTGTSTIQVTAGSIVTMNGNKGYLSNLVPGDTVKAYGTFNTRTRVLESQTVGWYSQPVSESLALVQKQGFFESIIGWFRLDGSPLSIR